MDLKDFVSETLIQVIDGVRTAQDYAIDNDALINPAGSITYETSSGFESFNFSIERQTIEFDIAITASESNQVKGGAGLFVAGMGLGGQGVSDVKDDVVSRIKFSIPVYFTAQHPLRPKKTK